MIWVSNHACQRFCERVRPCSIDEAKAAIMSHQKALEAAVKFGAEVVRCGDGSRLVLQGESVVTVYARGDMPRQLRNPWTQGVAL